MGNPVSFNIGSEVASVGTTAISTSAETTLVQIYDAQHLRKSDFSIYYNLNVGQTAQIVAYKYYFSRDAGATWFQLGPTRNPLENVAVALGATINAFMTTSMNAIDEIKIPACNGFKITGKAPAAATMNNLYVLSRDR